MDGSAIFGIVSVAVLVIGAVVGVIKRERIKNTAKIVKAALYSAQGSLAPGDDTPGRITPAEIGEIVEAAGKKAKEVLKDI